MNNFERGRPIMAVGVMALLFFLMSAGPTSGDSLCESRTFSGTINYNLSRENVRRLLHKLADSRSIAEVPKMFFGDLYNDKLVDLVAFFDAEGGRQVALVENCRELKELTGERNVYAMVFVKFHGKWSDLSRDSYKTTKIEMKAALEKIPDDSTETKAKKGAKTPEKAADSANVSGEKTRIKAIDSTWTIDVKTISLTAKISHSQLDYQRGAGEKAVRGIIGAVAKALSFSPPDPQKTPGLKDSSYTVKDWYVLYEGPLDNADTVTVLYAEKKIPIAENTVNGIYLELVNRKKHLYTRFGNYSASYIATSIGLMASSSEKDYDTGQAVVEHVGFHPYFRRMELEAYLLLHFYVLRPKLPPLSGYTPSLSAVIGSKIKFEDFPTDLFIGAGIGSIQGGAFHILAGLNLSRFKTQSGRFYKGEFMFGASYGI